MGKEDSNREIRIVGDRNVEDVTSGDYARSLEDLQRFLEVDISGLQTLEDTSARTSTIGRGLQRVLLSQGEFDQWEHTNRSADGSSATSIERSYTLRRQGVENEIKLSTIRAGSQVVLRVSEKGREREGEKFSVVLPIEHDIAYVDPEREMLKAYAFRVEEYNKVYIPVDSPQDSSVQQAFGRTLQDAIAELLPTLPQPTVIPFALE